jgi:S1-C subfamily serine protease
LRCAAVALALAVAAGDVIARSPGEQNLVRIVRQASSSVVFVTTPHATGSGVILRSDGVIATNAHVVGDEAVVWVKLADGRKVPGNVLGRDVVFDVAVILVPLTDLPAANLGDSDHLEVGETAVVIGNPLGLDLTVTTGVISALHRDPLGAELGGLIQTDAAMNPGNSGGALLDSSGRVVGIVAAVLPDAHGVGFAIPINVANDIVGQLLNKGDLVHAFLGIAYAGINSELAQAFRLPVGEGIIVKAIDPESPAAAARLREHDIIIAIDGTSIAGAADLRRALRAHKPGETIELSVIRGEWRGTIAAELAERKKSWVKQTTGRKTQQGR